MTTGITHQKKNALKWLTGLSVVVLFVILFFGLKPKDFYFSKSVSRIENQAGIRFRKYGIAYTDPIEELRKENGFGENGFSIEIALKPLNYEKGFNFIFALHNGNDRNQLLLGQWRSWIIAMNGDDYDHKRRVKRISVNSASRSPAIQLITLTTGKDGTNVYFNGKLMRTEKDLTLSIPYGDNARLLLGNSVYGRHSWKGEIYGLAFYGYLLADKDVSGHFHQWSGSRNFNFAGEDQPTILYLFDERGGNTALDHSGNNHLLNIPSKMSVLDQKILSTEWKRLELNSRSLQDMVINLIGFIPLGFVLLATFYKSGSYLKKHGLLITIAICFTVSLAIEILQAWIPSRSSDSLDWMLNTLGGFSGAMIYYKAIGKRRLAHGVRSKDKKS